MQSWRNNKYEFVDRTEVKSKKKRRSKQLRPASEPAAARSCWWTRGRERRTGTSPGRLEACEPLMSHPVMLISPSPFPISPSPLRSAPLPHSAGDAPHGRKLASLCQTQTCCRPCKVNYSAAIALVGGRARVRRESEAKHVLRRQKTQRRSSRRGSLGESASTGNLFPAGTLFSRQQREKIANFGFSFLSSGRVTLVCWLFPSP